MKNQNYPLATSSWDKKEYEAMQKVIDSGMFTMGPKVKSFEEQFSKFFGSKYSVMVNSGSSANLLMVAALFFRKTSPLVPGDEVIVPAVSWSTTYYPLAQYGLKLKFVDIDLHTLNYDLDALEKAISNKTKLIMVVNLLGNPNDFTKINSIISGTQIEIIEDNCESMGAKYEGKYTGTFGLMGTFSTFFSHHISTMEGGLIVTDDQELYEIMLSIRSHGWTRHLPENNLVSGKKSADPFKESFNFVLPGYNVRPLELSGAIGIEQLKKLPMLLDGRRKNALPYRKLLENSQNFYIQEEIGESSWFGFSLIIKENVSLTREKLIEKLSSLGIEYRPIVTGNFAKNKVCEYFDYEIHGKLKNAEYLDKNGIFIGNQHYDISDMIELINNIEDS